jgi:hypothetical protein
MAITGNSLTITFTNSLDTEFTLGNSKDGFSNPILAQDMRFTQSVSSPLYGNSGQTLAVEQDDTFVDDLKSMSPVAALAANPSGRLSVAVVWTCYPLQLRFGIAAAIDATRLDALGGTLAGAAGMIPGVNVSPPSPVLSWRYMMDSTPDQPVTWIAPEPATAPVTIAYPANPGFQLSITPIVGETSMDIQCTVQVVEP